VSRSTSSPDSSPRRATSLRGEELFSPPHYTPEHSASQNLVTPMRRLRIMGVLAIFFGWAALITGRLVWLQVINHADWADKAQRQEQRTFLVAPRRGVLYDRDLHELAMTVTADSVYAVPSELETDAEKEQTAAELARVVHTDPEDRFTSEQQILARLRDSRRFAWVARKQSPAVIAAVKALHLKGVYFQSEFKRFYPDQTLAAQVLGYVGMDDEGLAGVEQEDEKDLHGTPGHMLTAVDARRHVLDSEERDPLAGENLVLTIDANIQFMAEQALEHNMERTGAANGTVVVQDPHTGQILALAIRPTFDPNEFRHTDPVLLRDHAVSDVYEPGSTFKLVTYSAAIDLGLATPDSMVDCKGGAIVVAGRTVHDAPGHHLGVVTVKEALEESSDVGAIQMGLRMGKDNFYRYIRAYGFGQKTGIELPGETRGLVKPPNRWQPTTIGSIPMGQEIAVTPIQLAAMVSTIANGGTYLPPHIVLQATADTKASGTLKAAGFHPEDELPATLPAGAHRVISEMTSAQMRQMMEGVVLFGTGRSAQLNGYSAGGKTGTAQKIDPKTHTYSKTKYVASFAGFAPVSNPAVTIVVVMDSPTKGSHYGAEASGPLFHELAQQILEYLGVPHDQDLKPEKMIAQNTRPVEEGPPQEEQPADLESLFAEANHLPADDPLSSSAAEGTGAAAPVAQSSTPSDASEVAAAEPGQQQDAAPAPDTAHVLRAANPADGPARVVPAAMNEHALNGAVHVANVRVAVPSFLGKSLRDVVVQASGAGLGVQVVGSGIARDQAPAAGTLVPAGTEIIVRFAR
jgi:cell division protein FtsI (penicillin-binding protein 3)